MLAKMIKIALISVCIALLCLPFLIIWMAGGLQSVSSSAVEAKRTKAPEQVATSTSSLSLMTWNIAWAYGKGSEGHGSLKTAAEMQTNLDQIAATIKSADADLVLLQEVDFSSDRSFGTNQAKYLAEQAGYPFLMPAVSWKANYLPFPYWPPSEHWKSMSSGGAILSRYPLKKCEVELLPKPAAQNFAYSLFYLFRYLQKCELTWGEKTVVVYNTHLEAFDRINREKQMQIVGERIKQQADGLTIFGGDFNTVPAEADTRHNYPDEPETDHRQDKTLELLVKATGLHDTAQLSPPADQKALFTFPAHEPNRKLDYVFVDSNLGVSKLTAINSAPDASDHLPLITHLRLKR